MVPFELQLDTLSRCGIRLAQGVCAESLLAFFDRADFEADPYRLLLVAMGMESEIPAQVGAHGYPSDHIWHFDTERIYSSGDYADIANRLCVLAQGDLPLQRIRDYVNVEKRQAWLSFRLDGQDYRWEARVDDAWVDLSFLFRFSQLLRERTDRRRFTRLDLDGQDFLIGCSTVAEHDFLMLQTGLSVQWLG